MVLLVLSVGERRAALIVLLFCFCLLVSSAAIVFASSDNWIEVTRFSGSSAHGSIVITEPFSCDHVEWRIRWEFDSGHGHFPQLHFFSFTTYPQGEETFFVDQIYEMANGSLRGTSYIHDNNGTFYMKISTAIVDSYTIIVEQNIDSIPEFPSGAPLLIMLVAVLAVALVYRQILLKQNQRREEK